MPPEVPPVTDCGKEMEAEEAEQPTTPELLYMNWPEVQVPVMVVVPETMLAVEEAEMVLLATCR